ncbi:MAG: ABC transporter permease subunit [Bacillaceae bacterium]
MGKFVWRKSIELVVSVVAIIIIYFIPYVISFPQKETITLLFNEIVKGLLHPMELTASLGYGYSERPFLPELFSRYGYMLQLLGAAFLIGIAVAFLFVFLYSAAPRWVQAIVRNVMKVLECIPDLMLILLLQLFFIYLYKQTGMDIPNLYAFGDEKAYFIPIISLAIIPAVQLYKMMLVFMEEEYEKRYIELAVAKGLNRGTIIIHHMFRNMLIHILHHSKTILLFMLSALFVVEGLCNINGYMSFIIGGRMYHPAGYVIWVLLLFLPFYLLFAIIEGYIGKITGVFSRE